MATIENYKDILLQATDPRVPNVGAFENETPGAPTWGGTPTSQETKVDADGKVFIHTTVTWEAPIANDPPNEDFVSHYILAWRVTGDTDFTETITTSITAVVDFGILNEIFDIKVYAANGEKISDASTLLSAIDTSVDKTAPDAPTNFLVTDDRPIVDFTWDKPTQADYSHVEIVYSATSSFPTYADQAEFDGDTMALFLGSENLATLGDIAPNTIGYFWCRSVDTTGNKSNYVPNNGGAPDYLPADPGEQGSTVLDILPDAPANAPTNFAVASQVTTWTDTGEEIITTTLSWDAVADATSYTLEWDNTTKGTIGNTWTTTDLSTKLDEVMADQVLVGRIRAENISGASAYSTPDLSIDTGHDTTGPSASTSLVASDNKPIVTVDWDIPTDADYKESELWASFTNDRSIGLGLACTVKGTNFTDSSIDAGVTGYFWVRHIDYAGNYSTWFPSSATAGEEGSTVTSENETPGAPTWGGSPVSQSSGEVDEDGRAFIHTTLTWEPPIANNPPAEDTVTHYIVAWRVTGTTDWMETTSVESTIVVDLGLLGKTYDIRVVAVNGDAFSAWSTTLSGVDTSADTTGPDAPLAMIATEGNNTVTVSWTLPTQNDYAYTELFYTPNDNDRAQSYSAGTSEGNSITFPNLNAGLSGYFWGKTYDRLGNESAWYPALANNGVLASTAYVAPGICGTPTVQQETIVNGDGTADGSGEVIVRASVSWTAPTIDANSSTDVSITEYVLLWQDNTTSSGYSELVTTDTFVIIPPWMVGHSISCKVKARNHGLEGVDSLILTFTLDASDKIGPGIPTGISITSDKPVIDCTWTPPAQADYARTEVWGSTTNNRGTAVFLSDGYKSASIGDIPANTVGYLWFQSYDTTGNAGAWEPLSSTAGLPANTVLTEASVVPDAPTWSTTQSVWASQETEIDGDGKNIIHTTLTWIPPASTVTGYIISYREFGGNGAWIEYPITANTVIVNLGLLDKIYYIRVKSINKETESGWASTPTTLDTTTDTTGPSAAISLTATNGISTVTVDWSECTALDYKETQIWFSFFNFSTPSGNEGTNTATSVVNIATLKGNSYTTPILEDGLIGYFWVKNIDTTSNDSAYFPSTYGRQGSTPQLKSRDITAIAAPTISGSGLTVAVNTDSSCNISLDWAWGGTADDITGFEIFTYSATTAIQDNEQITYTAPGRSYSTIKSLPIDYYHTFAVRAYRDVDADLGGRISSTKVYFNSSTPLQPATTPTFSGDFNGTVPPENIDVETGAASANIGRPIGGTYSSHDTSGPQIGVIKIALPQYYQQTMIQMTIDIFLYAGASFSLRVTGYMNTGGWEQCTAAITGNIGSNNPVRFGNAGGKCCIWVGDTTDSWSHLSVGIRDVITSYNNWSVADWQTGWSVSVQSTLGTVDVTLSDTLVDANTIQGQGALAVLGEVTANEINVGTLSAISADMGTITAGDLSTTGFVKAEGAYADAVFGACAIVGNTSLVQKNGVIGHSSASLGYGVGGYNTGINGIGVYGTASQSTGVGVHGFCFSGTGVYGSTTGGEGIWGYCGSVGTAIKAQNTSSGDAIYATSTSGKSVNAYSPSSNCIVAISDSGTGVKGTGASTGVRGVSTAGNALYAQGDAYMDSDLYVVGHVGYGSAGLNSDARLKTNIVTIESALENVALLRGVTFEMDGIVRKGIIAQELQQVYPELVQVGKEGYLSIRDTELISVLIEAVKELKQRVEILENG